jgi:hypothetical protein
MSTSRACPLSRCRREACSDRIRRLQFEQLCVLVEKDLGLSRYSGVVAGKPSRHRRGKGIRAGDRFGRFGFRLLVLFPKNSAEQALCHR